MQKINRLSLYLINAIKSRRLVLGISAYQFALNLKTSKNYVSQIEKYASPKDKVLADIKELLKHLALTSKNPEEIAVVTKAWEEFKK